MPEFVREIVLLRELVLLRLTPIIDSEREFDI